MTAAAEKKQGTRRKKTELAVASIAPALPAPVSETAAIIQMIERAALNPNVDIDKMERLLQMHERIMARNAQVSYAAALAKMLPMLPIIAERGGIKNKQEVVQSKYALWEDIVGEITPVLSDYGFSLSFRTKNDNTGITVRGVLTHAEGHSEETELTLPADVTGSKNAVQAIGSSTSYGKRYTASALLNLRTGEIDDDGQSGPANEAGTSAEDQGEKFYPQDRFVALFPKWEQLITSGKQTADAVIKMISSSGKLTEIQLRSIRAIPQGAKPQ